MSQDPGARGRTQESAIRGIQSAQRGREARERVEEFRRSRSNSPIRPVAAGAQGTAPGQQTSATPTPPANGGQQPPPQVAGQQDAPTPATAPTPSPPKKSRWGGAIMGNRSYAPPPAATPPVSSDAPAVEGQEQAAPVQPAEGGSTSLPPSGAPSSIGASSDGASNSGNTPPGLDVTEPSQANMSQPALDSTGPPPAYDAPPDGGPPMATAGLAIPSEGPGSQEAITPRERQHTDEPLGEDLEGQDDLPPPPVKPAVKAKKEKKEKHKKSKDKKSKKESKGNTEDGDETPKALVVNDENQPPKSQDGPQRGGDSHSQVPRLPLVPSIGGPTPSGEGPHVVAQGPTFVDAQQHSLPMVAQIVVTVSSMSPVTNNDEIVHPLVRCWLVDGANGEALSLNTPNEPHCATVFPFDIRMHESRSPLWKEEISLPIGMANLESAHPEAMLLFEVCDFGNVNIQGEAYLPQPRPHLPIAWAFLRFRDAVDESHSGRPRVLQLFRAPERRSIFSTPALHLKSYINPNKAANAPMPHRDPTNPAIVPQIFRYNYAYPLNRQDEYPATLTVSFREEGPTYSLAETKATGYEVGLLEQYHMLNGGATYSNSRSGGIARSRAKASKAEKIESQFYDLEYHRKRGERCVPPDRIIHRRSWSGRVSAVCFSPTGRYIAFGITSDLETTVRIHHIASANFDLVGAFKGHVDYVHGVSFNKEETLLLSASADKTAKVWEFRVPCIISTSVDEASFLRFSLAHGCHVYSGVLAGNTAIVTAGYDKHLWVWSPDDGQLMQKVPHPHGMFYRQLQADPSHDAKLWALDIRGYLSVWRVVKDELTGKFQDLAIRRRIDCNGASKFSVAGNYAMLYAPQNQVMVIVEGTTFTVKHKVLHMPSECQGSVVTPDGRLGVFGTAAGRFLAWDLEKGDMASSKTGTEHSRHGIDLLLWSPTDNIVLAIAPGQQGENKFEFSILGRERSESSIIQDNDPMANDAIRIQYGGEIKFVRGGGGVFQKPSAARRIQRGETEIPESNKQKRIDQIMRYWNGLLASNKGGLSATAPGSPAAAGGRAAMGSFNSTEGSTLPPPGSFETTAPPPPETPTPDEVI